MLKLIIALGAAAAASAGGYFIGTQMVEPAKSSVASTAPAASGPAWSAAALGRVEPRSGESRIGAGTIGRIAEVLVTARATVEPDELLVRLDDDEVRARLAAAEIEVAVRKQERDKQSTTAGREDLRRAEDAVYSAERAVFGARYALDAILTAARKGTVESREVQDARKRLADARSWLQRERNSLAVAQGKQGQVAPNRLEASVNAARAEVAVAEAMLDKTRIRSPIAGSVLQLHARLGEMVGPSAEIPLVVIGDTAQLRVKAELDDADLAKVRVGQSAFVRSTSFPGRQFSGRVTEIAPAMTQPRIIQRGPRRATDIEVVEVMIELESGAPLLPGMRVETFFRTE